MGMKERLRARASGVAIDGALRGLSRVAKLHPAARPAHHDVDVVTNVPYARTGAEHHLLDVYVPRHATGPMPVVLYIHGGGFRILSKDSHWMMGLGFARRGYVVFNINYRLAPQNKFPAALEDAAMAYRFVLQHAAAFSGDPTRVIIAGESAGANLSLALTTAACFRREEPYVTDLFGQVPMATLPWCGLLQVADPNRYADEKPLPGWIIDRIHTVCGAYVDGAKTPTDLASPLLILESDAQPEHALPPMMITVGNNDPIEADSHRLARALQKRGSKHELRVYEGEHHAFQAFVWRKRSRQSWRDTYAFLDDVLDPARSVREEARA